MAAERTDAKTEPAYFVPEYELRDGAITPVTGKPVRRVPKETLFPTPGADPEREGYPLAVQDFNCLDPRKPEECLAFANRYGILGVGFWTPFAPYLALASPETKAAAQTLGALVESKRLPRLCHEAVRRDGPDDVTDVEGALDLDPSDLTVSLWCPEPVELWQTAWFEFHSILALLFGLQVLLWERHGAPATKQQYRPEALPKLREVAALLDAHFRRPLHPRLDEAHRALISDSPPKLRMAAALALVQQVCESATLFARQSVRPKGDLTGWELDLNPPCVLNLLYLAYFGALVTLPEPFRTCALPGCSRFARANSQWCCERHAARDRKRRNRATQPEKAAKPSAGKAKPTTAVTTPRRA